MLGQLIRFGGVGGIATLTHVLVALAAQRWMPVSVQQANFLGFLVAVALSYVGHARFTFHAPVGSAAQVQRFAFLSLLGLATSSSTVWLVNTVLGFSFGTAMAVVAILVPAATFLAMRFWVFRHAGTATQGPPWQGIAISAAVVLALPFLFRGQMLTNDVAWYLIATRDWLEGAPLYVRIMEINPPLNFYFTVPAILAADQLEISDTHGQYLVVWLVLFAVLVWCSAIIRAEFGLSPRRQAILLLGIAAAIIVPALDSLAQREFYLVVLMMPWLLIQVPTRPASRRQEITTAAVAALGVCLKPHFVLFPMAITVSRMIRTRSLWPILSSANLTFLAVGLAYIGLVALFHPSYLTDIVPMARLVYGAYSAAPMVLVGVVLEESLFLLLPALVALIDRDARSFPHPFVEMTLAGLLSYLLQAKGFAYHMIPFQSFGLMACILLLMNSKRLGAFSVSVGVAAAGVVGLSLSEGFPHNYTLNQVSRVTRDLGGVDSMMALTPHVFAGPPVAFELGIKWTSRYPANWLVPGALNLLAKTDCTDDPALCDQFRAIAARNRSENIEDMIANPPDLLVVDRESEYFDTPNFDWLAFMAEDPAWAGVFDDYAYVGKSKRYAYYLRSP